MHRRTWLAIAMALLGASLLVAAGFATPAKSSSKGPAVAKSAVAKKGGTLNVNMSESDVDYMDPALAYGTFSWQILYETCAKLVNYPDKPAPAGSRLAPEVSKGFPVVSAGGKTYTFTIKPGFKFNTGKAVTAANFKAAINRDLNPAMQSPAVPFIDAILGAQDVVSKKAKTASGVIAKGNKLIIKLQKADPSLLPKLAMNFFCAIPTNMPINPQGENAFAGAGPYYVQKRIVNRQIVLKRNPNYKGPRPHNIDTFIITANTDVDQSLLQVRKGQADYDMAGLPPTAHAQLAKEFGIKKSGAGRYFINAGLNVDYVGLNTSRPTFSNVALRKAANYAIDRPALLRVRGYLAGRRTDQILPPGIAGYRDANIYPLKGADYAKAKSLAGSKCGNVTLYGSTSPTGQALAQVQKYNLTQMGCNVTIKAFQGFQIYTAAGTKGEPFDAVFAGWFADYPDPFDFVDILLNGNNIHATNNNNLAYFNNPTYNKKMNAAARLVGPKRYSTYGKLDVDIMKNQAPWAAYDNRNVREFISARTGGYVYSPAYGTADLGTFFLK
jgi:ABC-type transport system substrate-binding protein